MKKFKVKLYNSNGSQFIFIKITGKNWRHAEKLVVDVLGGMSEYNSYQFV